MNLHRDDTLYDRYDLYAYDIYPKVLTVGKPAQLHIVNRGTRPVVTPGETYTVQILGWENGAVWAYGEKALYGEVKAVCDADGGFTFSHTFPAEMEYSVSIQTEKGNVLCHVYAVEGELVGKYPFMGDLHMHTYRSDGKNRPETVAAEYRKYGYDFLAITDHHRYYPSLEVMEFYKDFPMEYVLVPGEEVHLPEVHGILPEAHIVNFGGEYSINALVEGDAIRERGRDVEHRSLNGTDKPIFTREQYAEKMEQDAAALAVPDTLIPQQIAVYRWIFEEIRAGHGLGIFAHPTWLADRSYHVSDAVNDYLVENRLFDAFEVLGGERYFEQNGFQTVRYYEDKAKGYHYPIVGSTDSHCCFVTNKGYNVACTVVFSEKNERTALIENIKAMRSVAVDTIDEHWRVVGDMRLVRYTSFLLQHYFPYHDALCFEEGRLMLDYAIGTEDEKKTAMATMQAITGRMKKQREKYFDF